ncbi:helix-turn-helix transcriptional regulator [Halobellus sp. GM3]|uniref:helix-turn-helix transcriptional regulator n=1 Tax=Halobellus sp. GM3 TaxID=3458410 RepID=UPI00403D6D77
MYAHYGGERPANALAYTAHAPVERPEQATEPATDATELRTDGGQIESPRNRESLQWHELSGFQRDCLVAIARLDTETPPSGRDIQQHLNGRYQRVHHSQLYTNLDTLVADGYLEKTDRDGRTNSYQLTETGSQMLDVGARHLHATVGGGDR